MTVADTEGPWVLELHVPEETRGSPDQRAAGR